MNHEGIKQVRGNVEHSVMGLWVPQERGAAQPYQRNATQCNCNGSDQLMQVHLFPALHAFRSNLLVLNNFLYNSHHLKCH